MTKVRRLRRSALGWLAAQGAIRAIATIVLTCEYIAFTLRHWSTIVATRPEYITILWFTSFGHQAVDPHFYRLLYRGARLTAIVDDRGNLNRPLIDVALEGTIAVTLTRSRLSVGLVRAGMIDSARLEASMRLITSALSRISPSRPLLTQPLSSFGPRVAGYWAATYVRLLNAPGAPALTPTVETVSRVEQQLRSRNFGADGRWVAALYLRRKRVETVDIRDTYQPPYVEVVRTLQQLGADVFFGGEADLEVFSGLPGWLTYRDFSLPREEVDIYFLSRARLLVSGLSGTHAVASSFGTPVLITNAPFYYYSGWRPSERILFKRVVQTSNGHELAAREIFTYPIVEFNSHEDFLRAGLELRDNTSDELAAATREMANLAVNGIDRPAASDLELLRHYRSLLPPDSIASRSPSQPSWSYLRQHRDQPGTR